MRSRRARGGRALVGAALGLWLSAQGACSSSMEGSVDVDEQAAPASGQGAGAGDSAGGQTGYTPIGLSNEAVFQVLRDGRYRGEGFRRVDRTPFASTVSPDKRIALYISESGYDAYAEVSPDVVGSEVTLPVGTIIVREVLAAGDVLSAITAMVKLPKGSFAAGGDYWYASLAPTGEVARDPDGVPIVGLSERCGSCHLRRDSDDFLFGVPPDAVR